MLMKKYKSILSLLLCLLFLGTVSVSNLPYLHNLDADLNIWNVKSFVILEGKHNQEDNSKSPHFDFYKIKIIKVGECFICDILCNCKSIFSLLNLSFCYKTNYLSIFAIYSILFSSNIYNISAPRAPPLL